jgi:hypothetical protein
MWLPPAERLAIAGSFRRKYLLVFTDISIRERNGVFEEARAVGVCSNNALVRCEWLTVGTSVVSLDIW